MIAYRVKKIETIEFSIVADSEEDIKDYLYGNSINTMVLDAERNNSFIQVEEEEKLITPIMSDSICEINICRR